MADKIVGVYDIKVDQAVKNLNKLEKEVKDVGKTAEKSSKKVSSEYSDLSSKMTSQFKKVGIAAAAAFSIGAIVSYGKEAIKLAGQVQGVESAFKRLNRPTLLNELRRATRGTVSDLELMRQAVRAENFKVPLEKLGSFFEFATKRSIQTGESVDYLVNSIIDGIGRKSTLVMDNLGISASELQKEIKKTGDFGEAAGNIIERELGKAGDVADTTAINMAQLATSTENLKVAIGKILAEESGPFITFLTNISKALEEDITALDKLRAELTGESGLKLLARQTEEIAKLKELEREATESAGKVSDAEFIKLNEKVKTQREIVDAIEQELLNRTANNDETEITVDLINREVEAYRKLNQEQQENSITINSLTEELKNYNKDLKDAEVGSTEFFNILDKVTAKTKELNEAIALTKLEDALKVDEESDIIVSDAQIEAFNKWAEKEFPKSIENGTDIASEIWERYFNETLNGFEQNTSSINELMLDMANLTLNTFADIAGSIAQIQQNAFIAEQQELERQLEQGLITREQYEEKLNEVKRKQAQSNKDAAIFQATISTAQAVVNALGSAPFTPLNIATAAAIGAAGAAQIAAIASQPLPQFAEGGFINEHGQIKGRTHGQGGVTIEAEGNEFITAAKYAQPNKDVLKAINSGNWEKYKVENIIAPAIEQVLGSKGFEGLSASYNLQTNWTDRNLLKAHDRGRYAMKDGFIYLGKKIETLNKRSSRWN